MIGYQEGETAAYVAVTPGKTYNLTIEHGYRGRVTISYSQSINSMTPTVIDL